MSSPSDQPPPPVRVSLPIVRDVTDYVDIPGRTDAVDSVQVRARVSGYLDKINFQDGAEVQEGDVLFEIDPRPYKALLDQAEAKYRQSQVQVSYQESEFSRISRLYDRQSASKDDFEKSMTARDVAQAAVNSAKAEVEQRRLDYGFTKVLAPISGRASRKLVTRGNLITADSTLLTTVVSLDPIYGYVDVDERTVQQIQQMIREGKFKSSRDKWQDIALIVAGTLGALGCGGQGTLPAAASLYPGKQYVIVPLYLALANEEDFPHKGYIDFVNNRVDASTGTLQVRAAFPNPKPTVGDRVLSPGFFVRLRLPLGPAHKAILVSERAIGMDQGLSFVFVVADHDKVVRREVKLGGHHGRLREIKEGVEPGERVIVSGLQRVRPGSVVEPKLVDMPFGANH
jgi:RND family efflux transporter MFP subunit